MIIRGVGGCIDVLDEYFPYVTAHVHVAHAVVWSSGGWGGVLTSLTSTSLTLRHMYTLRMLSYDHRGGWGWGVVLTSLTSTSLTLRNTLPKKSTSVQNKIRYTWAYSWTWRHNAALLQSVASALPQALWHWSVEKRKKLEEWMSPWFDSDDWKS